MDRTQIAVLVFATAIAAFVLWSRRRKLPPHLRPYFKNRADLEANTQRWDMAMAIRKRELTDPADTGEASEYLMLNDWNVPNPTYEKALRMVEENLKQDPAEYGQQLGEIYSQSELYKNFERSYFYYFIGLSQNGCYVGFRDLSRTPPSYCGMLGDFRNEMQVCDLVDTLGWDKIKEIDLKAKEWLTLNHFGFKEFNNEDH